jgi:hypothetical protein
VFLALAAVLAVSSCGKDTGGGSGSSSASDLLKLLPREANGIFVVDVTRAMSSALAAKAMEERGEEMEEFTAQTGIDPLRDVSAMAGAIMDPMGHQDAEAALVMRVRYDRDRVLSGVEEQYGEVVTETYRDITLVTLPESGGSGEMNQLAFLDEETVAIGPPEEARAVIDVFQGRSENVTRNEALMKVVEGIDRSAIFWAGAVISEEAAQELSEGNSMLKNLSGLRSLVMSIDFKDRMLTADVGLRSDNQEQNTQIADFLMGMKSFAAMGASDNPGLAEVLRKITITSGPNEVKIAAAIPEDLLMSLEPEGE